MQNTQAKTETTTDRVAQIAHDLACEGKAYIQWAEVGPCGEEGFYIFDGWADVRKLVMAYAKKHAPKVFDLLTEINPKDYELDRVESLLWSHNETDAEALGWPEEPLDAIDWSFADSATICTECSRVAIETQPDSMSWRPDYVLGDGWIACSECIEADPDAMIGQFVNTRDNTTIPPSLDPTACGFTLIADDTCQTPEELTRRYLCDLIDQGLEVCFGYCHGFTCGQYSIFARWPEDDNGNRAPIDMTHPDLVALENRPY